MAICPRTLTTLVLGDLLTAFFLKISHVIQYKNKGWKVPNLPGGVKYIMEKLPDSQAGFTHKTGKSSGQIGCHGVFFFHFGWEMHFPKEQA